ncbi:ribosomal L7Ae/L30e/S12e/Gadd45 family protein [Candidatus Woesearchaeota archaeon]|nr:ribosomal L7Ae/L30e/S12e/Gadd45 family protein [Candidatus Woesearchaeota archaeon]
MTTKIDSTEIKKILKSGNLLLGTKRTIKGLKLGKVKRVLVSSNCPVNVEKDIIYYSRLCGAEFHKLALPNDELGIICKKPFSISVLAIPKGAK